MKLFFLLLQLVAHATTSYSLYDKCSSSGCIKTTWESNGKTVAGGNGQGNALNQFNDSYGVFVDSNDTVFVADYNNHRVMKWERGASSGILFAGGQCGESEQNQLCNPSVLTFDKEGTLFVSVENGRNGSLIRWEKGATSGETLITSNSSFYGMTFDKKEEYIYLVHHREHRVVKYTKNGTFVSVVAGGNGNGSALNQLDYPRGVAVDENGAVYVSDSRNHRVVKWTVGATEGIIVAGGNGNGSGTDQLTIPGGIIMDERGTIYIADEQNHRVISVPMGTRNGIVVAGGHGPGTAANQLNYLITLAFSPKGDLFVSDLNNFRIQKFEMDKNPSSGSDYIYNHYSKWTLISCFLFSMISIANLLK